MAKSGVRNQSEATGGRRKRRTGPGVHQACLIAQAVAAADFGVDGEALNRLTRGGRAEAEARQIAIYLAHVAGGAQMRAVCARFGRDRSTAFYACRAVEERREDPEFDARLVRLEGRFAAALELVGG